jgi:hypothetical protein
MVDVLGLIQKLISFMTHIDVRETVTLETLVPVILTPEERMAIVAENLRILESTRVGLEKKLQFITEEGLQKKVTLGFEELGADVTAVTAALSAGDVTGAEATIKRAQAMADDLTMLTKNIVINEMLSPVDGEIATESVGTTTETVAATSTEVATPDEVSEE